MKSILFYFRFLWFSQNVTMTVLQRTYKEKKKLASLFALSISLLFFSNSIIAQTEQTLCNEYAHFVPDLVIGSSENSITISSGLPSSSFTNTNIRLFGLLIINTHFTLQDCRVQIMPGGRIVILSNVSVSASDTDLFSCERMWQGILVNGTQPNQSLNLNNCRIEDAQYAIRVRAGAHIANLVFENNIFNRNYVGIYIEGNPNSTGNAVNLISFSNNLFTHSAPLNDPFFEQDPLPGSVSFAGMLIENCTVTGLGSYSATNNFELMQRGISATNSAITVIHCRFRNMFNGPANNDAFGIFAEGGQLIVAGNGGGTPAQPWSFFEHCGDYGIFARVQYLSVWRNTFRGAQTTGIYSNGQTGSRSISSNRFNLNNPTCRKGIEIDEGFTTSSLNILDNIITMTDRHARMGINVDVAQNIGFKSISNNSITITTDSLVQHGILIKGGANYDIRANSITFNQNNANGGWGIGVSGIEPGANSLTRNVIVGAGNINPHCSIHISACSNLQLCSNNVRNSWWGIHVFGTNNGLYLTENTIGTAAKGLFFDHAVIPQQVHRNNIWAMNYDSCSADYRPMPGSPLILPLYIEHIPLHNQVCNNGNNWMVTSPGVPDSCDYVLPIDSPEDWLSIPIGENAPHTQHPQDHPTPALLAERSQGASEKISAYSEEQSIEECLAQVRQMIRKALQAPDILLQIQTAWHKTQNELADQFSLTEALLPARLELLREIDELRLKSIQLAQNISTNRIPELESILRLNAGIPAVKLSDINQAKVNNHVIRLALNQATTDDLDLIFAIANQDPLEGGEAVTQARGLIKDISLRMMWEDQHPGHSHAAHSAVDAPEFETLLIYPNPASDLVNIRFEAPFSGKVQIADLTGRIRATHNVEAQLLMELPVNDLPSGIYFIILQEGAERKVYKLVKQ